MKIMVGVFALLLVCVGSAFAAPADPVFSPSLSDDEVRSRLLGLVPALQDPAATDRERVHALRIWLHRFVPAASSSTDVSTVAGRSHHQLSIAEMLSLAERREAGLMCGGHAELMRRLSRLLGFDAVAINFEVPGTPASHVVALVKVVHRGQPMWLVQDSYFNSDYADEHGEPIPFEDLLRRIAEGRSREIRDTKPWHVLAPALTKAGDEAASPIAASEVSWSLQTVITATPDLQMRLLQLAGTAHPAAFLLFPISTSGEPDAERLAAFARHQGYEIARQFAVRQSRAEVSLR